MAPRKSAKPLYELSLEKVKRLLVVYIREDVEGKKKNISPSEKIAPKKHAF